MQGTAGGALASYILTWVVVGLILVNMFLHARLWLNCDYCVGCFGGRSPSSAGVVDGYRLLPDTA